MLLLFLMVLIVLIKFVSFLRDRISFRSGKETIKNISHKCFTLMKNTFSSKFNTFVLLLLIKKKMVYFSIFNFFFQ